MSRRTASWLAWSLWAVCMALVGLALLLDFLTGEVIPAGEPGERPGLGLAVLTGVLSLAFPTVGALIASRLPTNPIGWMFCGVGLLYIAQRFTGAYANYVVLTNSALPGEEYAAWFSVLAEFSGLILAGIIVMLLFPDGHLLSRRWQIVAWMAVLGAVLTALYDALLPGSVSSYTYIEKPFGLQGYYIGGFTTYEFLLASALVGETLLLTSSLAAVFSLVLRLHRAREDGRQQLKWFLYAAVPASLCFSFVLLTFIVVDFTELVFGTYLIPFWENYYDVTFYVAVFALLVVPVFTYVAILRYRLFDIDVVINRTLVYGTLTVLLAAVYVSGVATTQTIFRALTGQEQQPQLAIVISTLVIAALFNPLRRRIQGFIDRRFYRSKYDAVKTLEAFSAKLRDETDLDALSDDLVGVVRETMRSLIESIGARVLVLRGAPIAPGTPFHFRSGAFYALRRAFGRSLVQPYYLWLHTIINVFKVLIFG
jgi:hypothetical protein